MELFYTAVLSVCETLQRLYPWTGLADLAEAPRYCELISNISPIEHDAMISFISKTTV